MTYDYKQLCAELVDDLELCDWPFKLKEAIRADIDRARAALAEPEPKTATKAELDKFVEEYWGSMILAVTIHALRCSK